METNNQPPDNDQDFGPLSDEASKVKLDVVSERDILALAKYSLMFLGAIFFIAVLYRMFGSCLSATCSSTDVNVKDTFSSITQIINPIATLILGYYFSTKNFR